MTMPHLQGMLGNRGCGISCSASYQDSGGRGWEVPKIQIWALDSGKKKKTNIQFPNETEEHYVLKIHAQCDLKYLEGYKVFNLLSNNPEMGQRIVKANCVHFFQLCIEWNHVA